MDSHQTPIRLSPFAATIIAATAAMSLVILAAFYLHQSPSLGMRLSANDLEQVFISNVYTEDTRLTELQGRIIYALQTEEGSRIDLDPNQLLPEPNQLHSVGYNQFLHQQQGISEALQNQTISLILDQDQTISISPGLLPFSEIPFSFWLINFFGSVIFLIGFLVYRLQPRQFSTKILLTGACGLFLSALTVSIYSSRELALPANIFFGLKAANVLGVMLFSYSIVVLFAYYPKRISPLPIATIVYSMMFILWLLETLQLGGIATGFYKYIANYLLGIVLALYQWRLTKTAPIERAALKWLMISITSALGLTIALYYIPIILQGKPVINLVSTYAIIFLLFIGFTLGISRYRLFNMERWWLEFWIWIASAVVIILVDSLLIANLDVSNAATLTVSLLVVGWLYFPVREWLLANTLKMHQYQPNNYLPLLIETLFDEDQTYQPQEQYTLLLQRIFNPLEITLEQENIAKAVIQDNGMSMVIPAIETNRSFRLYARNRGTRLFTPYDIRLQESLRMLANNALKTRQAYDRGVFEERQRIKRDLHDDVAVKLIDIIHNVDIENAQKARKALTALRQAFQILDNNTRYSLALALHHILNDVRQTLNTQASQLHLNIENDIPELTLSPRHMINIKKIIEENISNIIHHAQAENIYVDICWKNDQLILTIKNDGKLSDPHTWSQRKGLLTIKTRCMEIGGKLDWHLENKLCQFEIQIPLNMEKVV